MDNKKPSLDKATKIKDSFQVAQSDEPSNIKQSRASSKIAIYKPYHMILLVAGICIFIAGFLIFIFTHQPERFLFLIENKKRFMLALFMSVTASCFVVFGSYGKRNLGVFASMLASFALCYLPIHFKDAFRKERNAIYQEQYISSIKDQYSEQDIEKIRIAQKTGSAVTELDFFKANIYYEDIQKLKASDPNSVMLSLVIEQIENAYYADIVDYFEKTLAGNATLTHSKTKFYIKEKPAVVLSFQYKKEFETELKESFNIIRNTVHKTELEDVLHVDFNPKTAQITPDKLALAKMTIQRQLFLYALALSTFNEGEVIKALRFFQKNEKLLYANEILNKFNVLLNMRDIEFKGEVTRAIDQWLINIEEYPLQLEGINPVIAESKKQVVNVALKQLDKGEPLPDYFHTFTAKHQPPGAERILLDKWQKLPSLSEKFMISAAPLSEKALLNKIEEFNEKEVQSACSILSVIGSEASIPKLEAVLKTSSSKKNQQSLRSSIDVIKNRL